MWACGRVPCSVRPPLRADSSRTLSPFFSSLLITFVDQQMVFPPSFLFEASFFPMLGEYFLSWSPSFFSLQTFKIPLSRMGVHISSFLEDPAPLTPIFFPFFSLLYPPFQRPSPYFPLSPPVHSWKPSYLVRTFSLD